MSATSRIEESLFSFIRPLVAIHGFCIALSQGSSDSEGESPKRKISRSKKKE